MKTKTKVSSLVHRTFITNDVKTLFLTQETTQTTNRMTAHMYLVRSLLSGRKHISSVCVVKRLKHYILIVLLFNKQNMCSTGPLRTVHKKGWPGLRPYGWPSLVGVFGERSGGMWCEA